ncbi:MAG: cytochrome c-type biogenesis protein CcmH [Chloroflexi bacterium]|nr:cytochrome c-type biogenesis protein CcmH [Chloroflexota bacterium]
MHPAARRRIGLGAAAVTAVAIVALAALLALAPPGEGSASAPDPEAQALQLERQLLCPKCTNLRLDQCELQVCHDMRREIRDQLAAGAKNDDVLLFFSTRFGDRVLADLPRSGFNLVLFGWVGGSILLVAFGGGMTLWRLRRSARPLAATGTPSDVDERWLDDQLDASARGGDA